MGKFWRSGLMWRVLAGGIFWIFVFGCQSRKNEDYAQILSEARSIQSHLKKGNAVFTNSELEILIMDIANDGLNRWKVVNSEGILIKSINKHTQKANSQILVYYLITKDIELERSPK
jgi:hypothetical protein